MIDLFGARKYRAELYSSIGGLSIDPELRLSMPLVGYIMGIRSEYRLCDEVHFNLAYSWFCKFDLTDRIPDYSIFFKDRYGRFCESDVLRYVFEVGLCDVLMLAWQAEGGGTFKIMIDWVQIYDLKSECLIADMAYGSEPMLNWLVENMISHTSFSD